MTPDYLKDLLEAFKRGDIPVDETMGKLRELPFQDVGCAQVDHHRELRQGMPEVIFGEGKSIEQIVRIMAAMAGKGSNILVTRLAADKAHDVMTMYPAAAYHGEARCLTLEQKPLEQKGKGEILVVSAGTSDIPVAAEALVTARFLGNQTSHVYDVGVAGIHRLLARRELLAAAAVIIVVAGMEGALP